MVEPTRKDGPRRCRRLLITGATGFVGQWLAAELLHRDAADEVIGWAMHHESVSLHARITLAAIDLTDRAAVFEGIAAAAPSTVIHLAAIAAPKNAELDPSHAWDVNLFGTMNIADAVLANSPDARFIHVSSSEVYGGSFSRAPAGINESSRLEPLNTYALTKSAADLLIGKLAHDGLRAVRFRPFNHTGPGQSDAFVVASMASQIARIEHGLQSPVLYVGNVDVSRDILDVRDVVRAYVSAAMLPEMPGAQIFNLASGRSIRIGEIAERLQSMAKVKIGISVDPARVRSNDLPRTLGDARHAEAMLGWTPSIPIEKTLKDVLDHWRQKIARAEHR